MICKILSPAPYGSHDVYNDKMDVNVVTDKGDVSNLESKRTLELLNMQKKHLKVIVGFRRKQII